MIYGYTWKVRKLNDGVGYYIMAFVDGDGLEDLEIVIDGAAASDFVADDFIGVQAIHPTIYDDDLTGTEAADVIFALAGNDILAGLGGRDILDGGKCSIYVCERDCLPVPGVFSRRTPFHDCARH